MKPSTSPPRDGSPVLPPRNRALGLIASVAVLAVLYFARDVLVPIVLAVILGLILWPVVRIFRRMGLGQMLSVFAAVLILACALVFVGTVIGSELLRMAASLPQYRETIHFKLKNLEEMTVGRLTALTTETGRAMTYLAEAHESPPETPGTEQRGVDISNKPV